MPTIGAHIDELTKEYCEMYDTLKTDSVFDNPSSIALTDPIVKKFTWEEVYKNVKAYIEIDEQSN